MLNIITCVTNELRYWWETAVYLNNLKEHNYSNVNVLIFLRKGDNPIPQWQELQNKFPTTKFHFFEDIKGIYNISQIFKYTPLYRFWLLQEFYKRCPEFETRTILYTDTDIIFTKAVDLSHLLSDDVAYLSWTGNKDRTDNYLWQPYFDSKIDKVRPEKLEQYKKLDVLQKLGQTCEITRETITANNLNTGGAQYILKNLTSQFWTDCFNACCEIKVMLADFNQVFMQGQTSIERENNGFQSFCSDLWALLYTLWRHNIKTECPEIFDFSWSTDRLPRTEETIWIHNAGVSSEGSCKVAFEKGVYTEGPLFFKGKYQQYTPFDDIKNIAHIINHPVSSQFANAKYCEAIIKTAIYLNEK